MEINVGFSYKTLIVYMEHFDAEVSDTRSVGFGANYSTCLQLPSIIIR